MMKKSSSESSLTETVKTKAPPVRKTSSHSSLSADDEPESLAVIILLWPKILQPQTLALIHKLSKKPSEYPFILPQQTIIETSEEPETTEETLDTAYTKATTESSSLFETFKSFCWSAKYNILDDHDLQNMLNYYLTYHLASLLYTISTDPNAVIKELDDSISQHQMTISLLQNSLDNSAIQLVAQMEDFLKLDEEIKNKREKKRINKCLRPVAARNKAAWLCPAAAFSAAALYAFKRLRSSR